MSHNIYKEKFLSLRRPAWHGLGQVINEEIGAVQALQQIGGYQVLKTPLFAEVTGSTGVRETLQAKQKGLVADFGSEKKFLGVCDNRYDVLQPSDVAQVWDMTTKAHIETIGILSGGANLFISTKLPSYNVKGDEIENYLLVHSPCIPGKAATVTITPVRVVCQNTLSFGLQTARSSHRIIHTAGALNRLGGFMTEVWESTVTKAAAVKEAMEIMANTRVQTAQEAEVYVDQVFPYPTLDSPEGLETVKERQDSKRAAVLRLFDGGARGADTEAFRGTYFGLYNSVVEFADYYSRMNRESVVFGSGATLKQSAFDLALASR